MILGVTGKLEFFICTECGERWIGQSGEPRTQEWCAGHDKPHHKIGTITVPDGNPPQGFGRFTINDTK